MRGNYRYAVLPTRYLPYSDPLTNGDIQWLLEFWCRVMFIKRDVDYYPDSGPMRSTSHHSYWSCFGDCINYSKGSSRQIQTAFTRLVLRISMICICLSMCCCSAPNQTGDFIWHQSVPFKLSISLPLDCYIDLKHCGQLHFTDSNIIHSRVWMFTWPLTWYCDCWSTMRIYKLHSATVVHVEYCIQAHLPTWRSYVGFIIKKKSKYVHNASEINYW